MARRLPALMRSALRLAWEASRLDTLTVVACNVVAGAMTTSEVDALAEHTLLESLLALRSPGRAIVLITHRLSSVRQADRIVVLDHGRVVETGTHDTLTAAGGRYARMYALQAGRYTAAPGRAAT